LRDSRPGRERWSNGSCGGSRAMKPFARMVSYLQKSVIILQLTMTLSPPSGHVALAEDYPSRSITMIVPFSAGGSVDTLARILAERMKTTLGQPIVVEHRPARTGSTGRVHHQHWRPDEQCHKQPHQPGSLRCPQGFRSNLAPDDESCDANCKKNNASHGLEGIDCLAPGKS
jgi:hypothetical protein